ncbi:BCCT family transporter [Rubrobacter tropicus]|uniref:BCCT family transporter n=1 Tax=Rubrobacter tropicus TaxID=2653851 RepID=A0A6G8Q5Z8_9ACTN|nr:BCCT family transporter [Rubrobacter tropicus]QIN81858.1 BCCT family transporter [Rubrobacter tropicus]
MQRPANPRIDPAVFWIAAFASAAFVAWGILGTESLAAVFEAVLWSFLVPNFGWVFILSSFGFLAFSVYLAFSRYGKVRLGGQDEQPEFSTVSWVAMMFSAGMGIGLMFFGVAEPLSHMGAPPFGLAEPNTRGAAQVAMQYTYFHWAFHPWAIYAIMGLALAYFTFRKGMPNLISSAFYPLLGDRVYGPIGKTIDTLAIFATLFGSATSLGLGALQINQGLNAVFGIGGREAVGLAIVVIAVLTLAFVVSATSGVHRGIQWIANTNMVLAVFLLAFVFLLGPTVFILNTFTESLGAYLANIIPMSFRTASYGDSDFVSGWTIFYWAWWISWAPFVGVFIARISRGRTIREFVFGVVLAPSVVSFVWFAILGGSAIDLQLTGTANIAEIAANNQPAALFSTLQQFPLFLPMALITIILVALFFVSGADAASVVMGMLSSKGNLHPARWNIIVWGTFTGAAAAICLLSGAIQGSVDAALLALQSVAIASAAPFVLILIGLCFSILKALRAERLPDGRPAAPEPGRAMSRPSGAPAPQRMSGQNPRRDDQSRA